MADMNVFYVFLVPLAGLLLVSFVYWLLGVYGIEDEQPLASARFLVTQGRHVYQCDTEAEAVELAQTYAGVTRIERRTR